MEGLAEPPAPEEGGRLYQNIMYFARTLRAAGLPIGPGAVLNALQAVQAAMGRLQSLAPDQPAEGTRNT